MARHRKAVLLDTTVLIDLLHGRAQVTAAVRELVAQGFALATSCINVAELMAGMRKGEEAATEQLLSGLIRFPVTETVARKAGELVAERRRGGRTHSLDDMLIAATAMEHGYSILTGNRRDFEVPGLNLFVPEDIR